MTHEWMTIERDAMTWAIIADSSCNLRSFAPTAPNTVYACAPLKINVGGEEFVDDASLDVAKLNRLVALEAAASSSSCPSVGEWAELFRRADNIIAVTISSNLSGSFEAAQMARNIVMDEYMREHDGQMAGKNIFVLDSKAAGGKLEVIVELVDRYLRNNPSFEEAVAYAASLESSSQVLFSLSSYENLVKNGRMPRLAGTIASKLSIRVLGTANSQGTIKIVGPTRGEKKMYRKVVDAMRADGYRGELVYIDHVDNEAGARALESEIKVAWPQAQVKILPCGGLCSYYAEESGLIIGYEWL